MNTSDLSIELQRANITFEVHSGFLGLVEGVNSTERIVCATSRNSNGLSGRSCWLHGNEENWYLGLWSGIYFKFEDLNVVVDAVADLVSGESVRQNSIPGDLPISFVKKYRLRLQESDEA